MARIDRVRLLETVASALFLAAVSVTSPADAACKLTKIAEMPVKIAGDRVGVEAVINGEPVTLLADTGAAFSVLSPAAAVGLGLSIKDITDPDMLAVLGRTRMQSSVIDSLKLGALVGGRRKIMVSNDFLPDDQTLAGVVGEDVLARADVEFDLSHGVVRLFKSSGCSDADMPYWATGHFAQAPLELDEDPFGAVFTTVLLNGRPVVAMIDTGAPTSMVRLSSAAAARVQPGQGAGNESAKSVWVGTFDTLSVGDETVHNARIRLADELLYERMTALASHEGPTSNRGTGMLIGLDFFRSHRVLISPDHRMMYFTYGGGPAFQADNLK